MSDIQTAPTLTTEDPDLTYGQHNATNTLHAYAETDYWPCEPEDDYGYPVLSIDVDEIGDGEGVQVSDTGYGAESAKASGLDDAAAKLAATIARHGDTIDEGVAAFDADLRTNHGGAARLFTTTNTDGRTEHLVAYSTAAMARSWGHENPEDVAKYASRDMIAADEWVAYTSGDVFNMIVEEKLTTQYVTRNGDGIIVDEGTRVEWRRVPDLEVGGLCGTEQAREAIAEVLA